MITSPDKIIKYGIPIPPVGEPRESGWAYLLNRRAINEAWAKYSAKVKRFYDNIEAYFRELFYMQEVIGARIEFRQHEIDYVLDLSNGMCIHRTLPVLYFVNDFEKELSFSIKEVSGFIKASFPLDPAARAYNAKALELYGVSARLNSIE